MIIILDTNIFVRDFRMEGKDFRLFFDGFEKIESYLCIPAIVIDEVENKFREELILQLEQLNKPLRKLERLLNRPVNMDINQDQLQVECKNYHDYFLMKLLRIGIIQLAYPDTPHEEVVKRALERRRPFDSKGGAGYRDFLIWNNIMEAAQHYETLVVFITQNTTDFMESDKPHHDLLADLEAKQISLDKISFCNGLDSFNSKYILPELTKLEVLKAQFDSGTALDFNLHDWLSRNIIELIGDEVIKEVGAGLEADCGTVYAKLKRTPDIKVEDVRRMISGDIYVQLWTSIDMDLSVTIYWEDYNKYETAREIIGNVDSPFSEAWTNIDVPFEVGLVMFMKEDLSGIINAELEKLNSGNTSISFKNSIRPHRLFF